MHAHTHTHTDTHIFMHTQTSISTTLHMAKPSATHRGSAAAEAKATGQLPMSRPIGGARRVRAPAQSGRATGTTVAEGQRWRSRKSAGAQGDLPMAVFFVVVVLFFLMGNTQVLYLSTF